MGGARRFRRERDRGSIRSERQTESAGGLGYATRSRGNRLLLLRLRPPLHRSGARLLQASRTNASAAALRTRQLVEPLLPLHARRIPAAHGPVQARRHSIHHIRDRHGLASRGRCRSEIRFRLDRLFVEQAAVPRSRGVLTRLARAWSENHVERASARRRARVRRRLCGGGQARRHRSRNRRGGGIRPDESGFRKCLLRHASSYGSRRR